MNPMEMALASGVPGIQAKAFEEMMKTPDLTTAQKNARAIGLDPRSEEYNDFIRKSAGGSGGGTADISNYNFFEKLSDEEKQVFLKLQRLDPETAGKIAASQTQAKQGGVYLTPGQKKFDDLFATSAAEYLLKGKAQVQGNVKNLARKIKILKSGDQNVSGPVVGILHRKVQGFVAPDALAFIGDIEDIVFQSLKEKLGGQFSDSEGKRLVAAAFDQSLSEEQNIKRLERLLQVITDAAAGKEEMIAHFNDNGTLKGYVQQPLDFEFLFDSLIQDDFKGKTEAELEQIALEGDQATRDAIIRFLKKRDR